MTTTLLRNPTIRFANERAALIAETRRAVVARLDQVSPGLGIVLTATLDARLRSGRTPPVGEVWPWLLADLAGLPSDPVKPVAEAWLAMYGYSSLTDTLCDSPTVTITPEAILTASLLFHMGMSDLATMAAGQPWANTLEQTVRTSIGAQIVDVKLRGDAGQLQEKRKAAAGKNAGFVFCAAALAAAGLRNPTRLLRFAERVVLALQYLDDIGDFEEDYQYENYTPLLTMASTSWSLDSAHPSRTQLLEWIIETGALRMTLVEASDLLAHASLELGSSESGAVQTTPGHRLIESLNRELASTISLLNEAEQQIRSRNKAVYLERIEHRLVVVAQQS